MVKKGSGDKRPEKGAIIKWIYYASLRNQLEDCFIRKSKWYTNYQSNKECTGEMGASITKKFSGAFLLKARAELEIPL